MKKILCVCLTLCLMLISVSLAEKTELDLSVQRDTAAEDYAGRWVLIGAYLKDVGVLDVERGTISLALEAVIEENVLVDMSAYIHADVTNLGGILSFNHPQIDVEDYTCAAKWDQFGSGASKGATKFRIRDNNQGLFFTVITGADVDDEDMERMNVLAINPAGQLILGYSEDHIERYDDSEWEYAYIFERADP